MPPVARPDRTWCSSKSKSVAPSVTQVRTADRFVVADRLGAAGDDDAAGLQQVGVVGELERERRVLFDQQHADALRLVDLTEDAEQLLHDARRQAERGFVQQQEARA